ncbi:MAG: hypothetical protein AAFO77_05595 [Pseudomonadota bacterium]
MPAEYQALKDTPAVTSYAPSGLGDRITPFYVFRVPNGMITNSNRARPIIQFNATSRRKVTVSARLDGRRIASRQVKGGEHVFISEIFAWQDFAQDRLTPGTQLQLSFTGLNRYAAQISDVVIWYQTA